MSLHRALDRTTCRLTTLNFGSRPFTAYFRASPVQRPVEAHRRCFGQDYRHYITNALRPPTMESIFIQALIRASTCPKHSVRGWSSVALAPHRKTKRRRLSDSAVLSSCKDKSDVRSVGMSRQELRSLVDIYHEGDMSGPAPFSDSGVFFDSEESLSSDIQDYTDSLPPLAPIELTRLRRLLRNEDARPSQIFEAYQALPVPRAASLPRTLLTGLLFRLSVIPRKTKHVSLRYLSVLDDMKEANISIRQKEWNTAIHLAGYCLGESSSLDLESALSIWQEMEKEAGVQSSHVTFSILFDIAVKSGKHALAEVLTQEAARRGLPLDRFSRMAQIYFKGLQRDGDGVRRAYADLVEAGEIVDASVLNNVITSLMNAGELPAAEQVLERMKALDEEKRTALHPPRTWHERRQFHRLLTVAANQWRENPGARQQFEPITPVAPDWITYRSFIRYHATESGNVDRILELMSEMQAKDIALNGSTFFWLFKGFRIHGGIRYSSWKRSKLEDIWAQFIQACDDPQQDVWIDQGLAIGVVQAFIRCTKRERALDIWAEISRRWKPTIKALLLATELLELPDSP